jgi:hypothetical protein
MDCHHLDLRQGTSISTFEHYLAMIGYCQAGLVRQLLSERTAHGSFEPTTCLERLSKELKIDSDGQRL